MPNYDTSESKMQKYFSSPEAKKLSWNVLKIAPNYKIQLTSGRMLDTKTLKSQLKYGLDRLLNDYPDPGFVEYKEGFEGSVLVRVYDASIFFQNISNVFGTSGQYLSPHKYIMMDEFRTVDESEYSQWPSLKGGLDEKIGELLTTGTITDSKGNALIDQVDVALAQAEADDYVYAEIANFKIHPYHENTTEGSDAGVLLRFSGRQPSYSVEKVGWDMNITFSVTQFKGVSPKNKLEESGFGVNGLTVTSNPLFWPDISVGGEADLDQEKIERARQYIEKEANGTIKAFLNAAEAEGESRIPYSGQAPQYVQKGKQTKKVNPIPDYGSLIDRPPRPSSTSEEEVIEEDFTALQEKEYADTSEQVESPAYTITDMGMAHSASGVITGFFEVSASDGTRIPQGTPISLQAVGITYIEDLLSPQGKQVFQEKVDTVQENILSYDFAKQGEYPKLKGSGSQTTLEDPESLEEYNAEEGEYSLEKQLAKGGNRTIVNMYTINFAAYSKNYTAYSHEIKRFS